MRPAPPSGTDALPRPAGAHFSRWEYHFSRNALLSSVRAGSSFIAIAEAGHVLRFDQKSLALNGELLSARKASVLGPAGEKHVVVGFESGRIARLDVLTLSLETLGIVPGMPVWIGETPDQELVVVYGRRGLRTVTAERSGLSAYHAKWFKSGAEVGVSAATAFFADSSGRLWLGADHGEWGGQLQVIDLRTREVRSFAKFRDNVYGFVEPKPGEVWVHGGVLHMGSVEAFIARVAPGATPQRLFHARGLVLFDGRAARRWLARPQPHAPITHIVRQPTGKLLVFAYGELLETDVTLRAFRLLTTLHLRQTPGRPDAVASYPAIRIVHVEPDRIVLASARDGYLSLQGDRVTPHAIDGQIGARAHAVFANEQSVIVFDHVASLWSQGRWKDVPMRSVDEMLEGPALPPGSEQALAEAEWKRAAIATDRNRTSTPWDEGALLANDAGLCVMPQSPEQACTPIEFEGVDDTATVVARDKSGRVWLAGRGLWFLDASRRAIAVHASLPFIADTEVESLTMLENRIVLALGSRGLAILDLRDLRKVTDRTALPRVDEWDRRQQHEPNYSDGAVFVTAPPEPWPPRTARERYELGRRLDEAIADSPQPIYSLDRIRDPVYGEVLAAFGSSDPDGLVQLITRAIEHEPLRPTLRILRRRGAIGTPLVEVR